MVDAIRQMLRLGLEDLSIQPVEDRIDRFIHYLEILQKWNSRFNLVGNADPMIVTRAHLLDSLVAVPHVLKEPAKDLCDFGAGAGFPGLCIAMAIPDATTVLIEIRQARIEFLRTIIRECHVSQCSVLPIKLLAGSNHSDRAGKDAFDVIFARAFGSIGDIVSCGSPLLRNGGRFILHRGSNVLRELDQAAEILAKEHVIVEDIADGWPLRIPPESGDIVHKRLCILRKKVPQAVAS